MAVGKRASSRNKSSDRFYDACGLVGGLTAERTPLSKIVDMIDRISHRGGDGIGVYFRIGRDVLEEEFACADFKENALELIPKNSTPLILTLHVPSTVESWAVIETVGEVFAKHRVDFRYGIPVSLPAPGEDEVVTWRVVGVDQQAGFLRRGDRAKLLTITQELRRKFKEGIFNDGEDTDSLFPVSFSDSMMVLYKLIGDASDFRRVFKDEIERGVDTDLFLSHVRYSTNTLPTHRAAQPMDGIAHNGEINNIESIRRAMKSYGFEMSGALSDSADLNELVNSMTSSWGYYYIESLYLLFPKKWFPGFEGYPKNSADRELLRKTVFRNFVKRAYRPFRAEGPAAIIATDGENLVGRLDNMGLRPLFLIKSLDGGIFFSSEVGAPGLISDVESVHMLRPGEIITAYMEGTAKVLDDAEIEEKVLTTISRAVESDGADSVTETIIIQKPDGKILERWKEAEARDLISESKRNISEGKRKNYLLINGFSSRVMKQLDALFFDGKELGSGTGWRGGLAVNREHVFRFSELFKSMTAQVTAPTISAEHEMSAMDSSMTLGRQFHPNFRKNRKRREKIYQLDMPFILGFDELTPAGEDCFQDLARELGLISLKELTSPSIEYAPEPSVIDTTMEIGGRGVGERTSVDVELFRICKEAERIATEGKSSIILFSDSESFTSEGRVAIPPEVVVGSVDRHLMNLEIRHCVHLVIASEEINDPHTMFVLLQLGADALAPTMLCREMLRTAFDKKIEPGRFMLDGIRAIRKALAIMYGRIATNHFAAGRGGRKISSVGLGKGLCESLGLRRGIGSGIGFKEVVRDMKAKAKWMREESLLIEDDVKRNIDTMPYKTSIAIYGLLGGFRNMGEESFSRPKGQVSLARKTLLPVMKSKVDVQVNKTIPALVTVSSSKSAPPAGNGIKAGSIFKRVEDLSLRETARVVGKLFIDYKLKPANLLDSLLLKKSGDTGIAKINRLPSEVGSGIDGRSTNQIIGAISYGANNRYVHELYARVMALYGGMSNGGEGGVPDNIRALYITSRLKKEGADAKSLTAHLRNETPLLLEEMDDDECEQFVSSLLRSVPIDFTASRFEQISTGRFGVGAFAFLDTEFVEIKIGQGAKPGVGGSLPGTKVLPHIAITRGVNIGQTLNSPTVHHDIYSIEDLRQLVTSLKTFNPKMKVCVKLAAMDDLDIVALGVVKSGADYIWVDGYEGGTGSAKDAHKEHCGLPSAPIINRIHKLLIAEGMRGGYFDKDGSGIPRSDYHRLDEEQKKRYRWHGPRIIGAGGVRYAEDAIKLVLAGSDYVGYGDAAQNAVGCVRCHKCPTGKCPSYITTNVASSLKLFDVDTNSGTLRRFVEVLDTGMKELALSLDGNLVNLEQLVGRTDLLERNPNATFRANREFFEPAVVKRFDIKTLPDAYRDTARVMTSGANVAVAEEFGRWRLDIEKSFKTQGIDITDINVFGRNGSSLKIEDELLSRDVCVVVTNEDRLIGANIVRDFIYLKNSVKMLTGKDIHIHIEARGPAGSGFGMFSVKGMDFTLTGSGGDYLGEAINGSRIFVMPFRNREGRIITGSGGAGNAVAYGMRDGEIHLNSMPGTRFAIRFSGGKAFVWGDAASVKHSFDDAVVTPQFFCEYMTKGTIVFCPTPGYNLLRAATGVGTEVLCRKPDRLGREEYVESLEKRIPSSFEVVDLEVRHVELIEKGKAEYTERAIKVGITEAVTPIADNENLFDTFVLIREKEGTVR